MTPEDKQPLKKKPYTTPELTIHGDVETITLGDDLGESLDAAFTNTDETPRGRKKPRVSMHS